MRTLSVFGKAVGLVVLGSLGGAVIASGQTVAPCTANCAQLSVEDGTGSSSSPGTVAVEFAQAPSNGAVGGPDEIAALAFSLEFPGDDTHPLALADCSLGSDEVPASVRPSGLLSNFRVVVVNAVCREGQNNCLCPEPGSGITPDNFINIAIYGPNLLPTPGPGPIEIPLLPSGRLLEIDLLVADGVTAGEIPLHIVNEVEDAERPMLRAFASIGDREAVDQTCVPVAETPPCGGPSPVSQLVVSDGTFIVGGCVGDCSGDGAVTVDEIITMVNIGLGTGNVESCRAGDESGDGQITVDEILRAVNNALNGCS